MDSRAGNWNEKNIQLYNSTVNYDNNTCQLNPYRTKYLVEVSKMSKQFIRICHSCGRELYTYEPHYQAKLVDSKVYFHVMCYIYYVKQKGDVLTNVLKKK
jgi:hypothetical protein